MFFTKKNNYPAKAKAFTLIELLVVITVLSMLIAILMPVLSNVKGTARQVACMTNLKSLHLAWTMYAQRNKDDLVHPGTGGYQDYYWVDDGPLAAYAGNTEDAFKDGALWPYTQNTEIYHCPSDKTGLLRSYSISWLMGHHNSQRDGNKIYHSKSQINRPSSKLLFIDAMPWNLGITEPWLLQPFWPITTGKAPKWKITPTITARHNNGCNTLMADGHAGKIRWRDPLTLDYANRKRQIDPEAFIDSEDLKLLNEMLQGARR